MVAGRSKSGTSSIRTLINQVAPQSPESLSGTLPFREVGWGRLQVGATLRQVGEVETRGQGCEHWLRTLVSCPPGSNFILLVLFTRGSEGFRKRQFQDGVLSPAWHPGIASQMRWGGRELDQGQARDPSRASAPGLDLRCKNHCLGLTGEWGVGLFRDLEQMQWGTPKGRAPSSEVTVL